MVQEHERVQVRLGFSDCLQEEKEIRKESSDLSNLHKSKIRLFVNPNLPAAHA